MASESPSSSPKISESRQKAAWELLKEAGVVDQTWEERKTILSYGVSTLPQDFQLPEPDQKLHEGWSPDSPTVVNENGGKQSALPFRFDLIDARALATVAEILHDGAEKYGQDNWRRISVESNLNHAIAHIYGHLAGDVQDNHLGHAACRIIFALAVLIQGGPITDESV